MASKCCELPPLGGRKNAQKAQRTKDFGVAASRFIELIM
jgi:hypothetical protein